MVTWFKLTKNQYIGFWLLGLALFVLQELPYIIMPFIPLQANPLMEMVDRSAVLNAIEKILGVSCIVVMMFLVHGDAKWFSLSGTREILSFNAATISIAAYFVGWGFYFSGYQSLALILCVLVAMPPIYYASLGLWRRNYPLAALGCVFLIAHITNVWNNLT